MVPILDMEECDDLLLAASQLYEAQEEEVLDEKYSWMQDEDFAYGRLIEGVQCDAGPLENEHEHGYDGKGKENAEPNRGASRFAVPVTEKDILQKIEGAIGIFVLLILYILTKKASFKVNM